jgi:hypothetical protein
MVVSDSDVDATVTGDVKALLASDQIHFFERNGFLTLRGIIPTHTCDQLVEESWKRLPATWDRHRPETWTGKVTDSCHTSGLTYRRGHLKFQKGALVEDQRVTEAFGPDSALGGIAGQMLGQRPAVRYRGLYMIVPFPDSALVARYSAPHIEAHPVQIVATAYLADVDVNGGALLVWPGSHRALYSKFKSKLEFVGFDKYKEFVRPYRELEPLEIPGKKGDVILIHHRLLHAPSLNRSDRIRFALFSDYMLPNFPDLCKQSPGEDPFEDWRGASGSGAQQTDYVLKRADPADLIGLIPVPDHYSTQNKRDASTIKRMLRPSEDWLVISARADLSGTNRVEPCGENLTGRGLQVSADGTELFSVALNDFVVPLPANTRVVSICGAPVNLFVRIVRIGRPTDSSDVLIETSVPASASWDIRVHRDWPRALARLKASCSLSVLRRLSIRATRFLQLLGRTH